MNNSPFYSRIERSGSLLVIITLSQKRAKINGFKQQKAPHDREA